jgi:hypothetical protein
MVQYPSTSLALHLGLPWRSILILHRLSILRLPRLNILELPRLTILRLPWVSILILASLSILGLLYSASWDFRFSILGFTRLNTPSHGPPWLSFLGPLSQHPQWPSCGSVLEPLPLLTYLRTSLAQRPLFTGLCLCFFHTPILYRIYRFLLNQWKRAECHVFPYNGGHTRREQGGSQYEPVRYRSSRVQGETFTTSIRQYSQSFAIDSNPSLSWWKSCSFNS